MTRLLPLHVNRSEFEPERKSCNDPSIHCRPLRRAQMCEKRVRGGREFTDLQSADSLPSKKKGIWAEAMFASTRDSCTSNPRSLRSVRPGEKQPLIRSPTGSSIQGLAEPSQQWKLDLCKYSHSCSDKERGTDCLLTCRCQRHQPEAVHLATIE